MRGRHARSLGAGSKEWPAVSFQGTLDLFGLPEILRLLATGRKDARLALQRDGAAGAIWLAGGAVAWAASRPGPGPLARRLLGLGLVEPDALAAALREAAQGSSLTAALRQAGAVPDERLAGAATEHLLDELFDLARWPDGSFSFERDGQPPEALDPPAAVEDLLAETERRLAAWPEVAARVPGRAALLSIPPRRPDAEVVTVDAAEWRMLAAVGGSRAVASLIDETGQGEFQTCQALAAMVERGLLAAADEASGPAPGERALREALAAADPAAATPAAATPEAATPEAATPQAAEPAAAEPAVEEGPGGDAAGPAPAPGPGLDPEAAQALLEKVVSGVRPVGVAAPAADAAA
jgi:Domain of unknown function (DUF4388)